MSRIQYTIYMSHIHVICHVYMYIRIQYTCIQYMSHVHVYICMSVLFITLSESLDVSTQQYSDVEKNILKETCVCVSPALEKLSFEVFYPSLCHIKPYFIFPKSYCWCDTVTATNYKACDDMWRVLRPASYSHFLLRPPLLTRVSWAPLKEVNV